MAPDKHRVRGVRMGGREVGGSWKGACRGGRDVTWREGSAGQGGVLARVGVCRKQVGDAGEEDEV